MHFRKVELVLESEFYFSYLVELFFMISGFWAFRYIKKIKDGIKFIEYIKGKFFRIFVGLSNICYSEFKYSRSTSLGVFHPSGRMGKSL